MSARKIQCQKVGPILVAVGRQMMMPVWGIRRLEPPVPCVKREGQGQLRLVTIIGPPDVFDEHHFYFLASFSSNLADIGVYQSMALCCINITIKDDLLRRSLQFNEVAAALHCIQA